MNLPKRGTCNSFRRQSSQRTSMKFRLLFPRSYIGKITGSSCVPGQNLTRQLSLKRDFDVSYRLVILPLPSRRLS